MKAERATTMLRGCRLGDQRVARCGADALAEPIDDTTDEHDRPHRGCGDEHLSHGGEPVAGTDERLATPLVRPPPGDVAGDPGRRVGGTLDDAQHHRRRGEHTGEQHRQQRVEQLARRVLEQRHEGEDDERARQPDPGVDTLAAHDRKLDREDHRHTPGAAHLTAGPGDNARRVEFELGDPGEELLDRHPQLHAGEVRPGAAMDARRRTRRGGCARGRAAPCRGRSNIAGSRFAAGKFNSTRSPACIGQPANSTSSATMRRHRDRRVGAQQLLDRGGHQRRLVHEAATILGVRGEMPHRRTDRRPRRVDPGDQGERDGAEHVPFGHGCAVDGLVAAGS